MRLGRGSKREIYPELLGSVNFSKGANFILKRIPSDFGLHSYIREAIDFFYVQRNDADNEYLD